MVELKCNYRSVVDQFIGLFSLLIFPIFKIYTDGESFGYFENS